MKEDSIKPIHKALEQFLKTENLEDAFYEKKLIASWREIMGNTIASKTQKLNIRNKVLYATMTSAPLKQHLNLSKEKVLNLLEEKMGRKVVEEVRFL